MVDFNVISNNIKGLKSETKRLRIFNYLKDKLGSCGILMLQETHSSKVDELQWKKEFQGDVYFSHGKTNACGVLIAIHGIKQFNCRAVLSDDFGRILIVDALIDDEEYIFVNLYNANLESEQIKTLKNLENLIEKVDIINKRIILGGDFNFFFDKNLETKGGNPTLKKSSISSFLSLKESLNLCDIWRIKNPLSCRFTFRQNHSTGLIQRRLDYLFISIALQERVEKVDILNSLSTDHSPVFCSLGKNIFTKKGPGLWRFNNSLVSNEKLIEDMKSFIENLKTELGTDNSFSDQTKWEYMKYELRNFLIKFSKNLAKSKRQNQTFLENRIKELEQNLISNESLEEYNKVKSELEQIYDKVVEGVKVRTKCDFFQFGEKSNKFFFNLEKQRSANGILKKVIKYENEITDNDWI